MLIQITPDGFLALSKDAPVIGRKYTLEDAETGSGAQNRAWHALAQEYWRTGLHSYPAKTFSEFRDFLKRDLGAGFESFVYASPDGVVKVNTREEIPQEYNNSKYAMGRLKSWADYTLKERRESIDRLIAEMVQAGVNTPKMEEIIAGMESGKA
jgi:hypothetical protein